MKTIDKSKLAELRTAQQNFDKCQSDLDDYIQSIVVEYGKVAFRTPDDKYEPCVVSKNFVIVDWFLDLTDNAIQAEWFDHWNWGGFDEGWITVPWKYFEDPSLLDDLRVEMIKKAQEEKERAEREAKESRKKVYEKLRKEFE